MTARKQTERQTLSRYMKWLFPFMRESERKILISRYFWAKLESDLRKINKNDLNEGNLF